MAKKNEETLRFSLS